MNTHNEKQLTETLWFSSGFAVW